MLAQGVQRLAKKNFDTADSYWKILQSGYHFSDTEQGETQRELALGALKQNHPNALQQLAKVSSNYIDEELDQARVKFALVQQDWQTLLDFATINQSKNIPSSLQLRYWYARALEQLNKAEEARKEYQSLAKERDYYGFLAADRLGVNYDMQHHPVTFTPQEEIEVSHDPSMMSAYEFHEIGMSANARLEWEHAIGKFSIRQRQIASVLASQWKWYDRAIFTAAKAQAYDDLDVRFPTPYRENLEYAANAQGVDLAWVYGIVRQESAFMADARSPAGALGLMQLMPATGRHVANKLGVSIKNNQDILEIETNVSLGTAYLREVLDNFNGNHMLATAAYNAGPGRAKQWAQEYRCVPADVWVEMIPFKETRNYVRLVLFYTNVFEHRLNQPPRPLRVALAPDESCVNKVDDQNVLQALKASSMKNFDKLAENIKPPYAR
jgi:soluble lytic murein transglycosylase